MDSAGPREQCLLPMYLYVSNLLNPLSLYDNYLLNPLSLCDTYLLNPQVKADLLFSWIVLDPESNAYSFDDFFVAMRSFERYYPCVYTCICNICSIGSIVIPEEGGPAAARPGLPPVV
jgi:hypothetical protein